MDEVERIAHERKPKLILAGWSRLPALPRLRALPRDRRRRRRLLLMVDMAHFAGLVAAGQHPNPVPYADVVTTTVHKTLGGARGGMILCREEYAKKINSAVFPGQQGGPLEHVIAGKAVALQDRADRALPRAPAAHGRRRQGARRGAAGRGRRRQRPHRRHRRAPRARRPARLRARRPAGRGPPARRSASRSTATRSPSTRGRRWSPAACASARQRAGHARPAGRGLPRGGAHHRRGAVGDFEAGKAELAERVTAIADRYPLYEHLAAQATAA